MTAIISGGFDPIHIGHIRLIRQAHKDYGQVAVILNTDDWLTRKKGKPFMPYKERAEILSAIEGVHCIYPAIDDDDTVVESLKALKGVYGVPVYCNGGDRTSENTPEVEWCKENDFGLAYDVGGGKVQSSSDLTRYDIGMSGELLRVEKINALLRSQICSDELVADAKANGNWVFNAGEKEYQEFMDSEAQASVVQRLWGSYRVLAEYPGCKVKELTVDPHKATSKQYHKNRYELWFYLEGKCKWHQHTIAPKTWHQLTNSTDEPMTVIEIQYGTACEEADIVRWEDQK